MKADTQTGASRRVDEGTRAVRRRTRPAAEELEPRYMMARVLGIDLSHWEPATVNWNQVRSGNGADAPGYSYAYAKATEGNFYKDANFPGYVSGAHAAGFKIGAYDYARYDLGIDPVVEANYFLSYASSAIKSGDLVPMLDVEAPWDAGDSETYHSKAGVSNWVKAWCNRVQAVTGVLPIIYTGLSYSNSWLDSTVSQTYPVWVAAYPSTSHVDPQTANPSDTSPGPWSTWQMWQYSDGSDKYNDGGHVYGLGGTGVVGRTDADVLNGDIYALEDYVIGSPGRFADGTRVRVTASSLNVWDDSTSNSASPYNDNILIAEPSGTTGTILQGPVYANSFWRYLVQYDDANHTVGWSAEVYLTPVTPGVATSPAPASNPAYVSSLPAAFTWTAANATSYDVYLDGVKKTTVTTNSWAPPALADGTHTWRVDAKNAELTTTGTTWTFAIDTAAPTATYGGQLPSRGATTLTFTVTYADAASGVRASSLNTGNVVVTGPNGFSQVATLLSVDSAANGSPRTATYSVTAPGGTWDNGDNGNYTVTQASGQVLDVAGNARPAGTIGTFALSLAAAYTVGSTLIIDYPGPAAITLSASGANLVVTQGTNTYTFSAGGITGISVNPSTGTDSLVLSGNILAPITFSISSGGSHSLTVNPFASASLASDLPGYAVTVGTGGSLDTSAALHLASLILDGGSLFLPDGGTTPITLGNLSITTNGQLQLENNALIWDYTGASPIDTLRTYLFKGWHGGTWYGTGGIASAAIAANPQHAMALGYMEASTLGVTSFAGQPVDSTALLVKPTYAGDANLDGVIDADDYALTDRGFARNIANAHWLDGDYDYSGILDANDYLILDTSSAVVSGAPSPSLLAMREAMFGPSYGAALEQAITPSTAAAEPSALDTSAFSTTPIDAPSDPTRAPKTATKDKPVTLKPTTATIAATSFTDASGDDVVDQVLGSDSPPAIL